VITSLNQGGAETVLFRLINATRHRYEHAVVSLSDEGYFASLLREQGITVFVLDIPRGQINLRSLRRLRQIIREFRPEVIQTRLHHANLLGGLAARFTGAVPVVWAVHSSYLGTWRKTWKTRLVRRFCSWLSHALPEAIISDAQSSAELHMSLGFARNKMSVIYNGVDGAVFRPDEKARFRIRAAWGVGEAEVLAGSVARWDPLKDHDNLLRAVRLAADEGANFRCVLVGSEMTLENPPLRALIEQHGVGERVLAVGPSPDVPGVMAALDLLVMSSLSESMPVAVVEAMACAVPCLVTDVGDSAAIVGDTGWVMPARDSRALADSMKVAVSEIHAPQFAARAEACRSRIAAHFSLERMSQAYAAVWERAAARGKR
jgi:glycosyltransferase involved in cell wall biosynthesis